MSTHVWLWIGFNLFVVGMIALDLSIFHRRAHAIKISESLMWSGVWIALALLFNLGLYFFKGHEVALQFLAGYLIEKSLSVDNLFIFLIIFSYFKVEDKYQHEVLFWGILGALVMRATMIVLGSALIAHFHWLIYLFGFMLIATAIRLALQKPSGMSLENNWLLRFLTRHVRFVDYHDDHFFIRQNGQIYATRLFLVLLTVELTDLIFAIDSIPAIFAITPDPFIVYTSNVFAILGLRSLYFALAGLMKFFHFLKKGLSLILGFVGIKMLLSEHFPIPISISLIIIASILIISILLSLLLPPKNNLARQIEVKKDPDK